VHGEKTEMQKLKDELVRQYDDYQEYHIQVYNPRNTQPVELYFRGEKNAKVVGKLASLVKAEENARLSGILVKRNFKYHIMLPEDLHNYTDLTVSTVLQRQSVPYTGTPSALLNNIYRACGDLKPIRNSKNAGLFGVKVYEEVDLYFDKDYIVLEVTKTFLLSMELLN
jgi:cleavage and polyadenylation specificity factor subunit 3